jgi:predicted transcriptional regulator
METTLLTKKRVLQVLSNLPDEFTAERLVYECYVVSNIERGLEDKRSGRVFSMEEAKKRLQDAGRVKQ